MNAMPVNKCVNLSAIPTKCRSRRVGIAHHFFTKDHPRDNRNRNRDRYRNRNCYWSRPPYRTYNADGSASVINGGQCPWWAKPLAKPTTLQLGQIISICIPLMLMP